MTPAHIRPFVAADYPAAVALWNVVYPQNQLAADELRERDGRREAHIAFQRFVVEDSGELRAFGHYSQDADAYHPQQFTIFVCAEDTTPWSIRRTLGTHLLAAIEPLCPSAVYAMAREDMPNARLYPELGFQESGRTWESRLDPAALDQALVDAALAAVHQQGYQLQTLRELADDALRDRKLYALVTRLEQDVPRRSSYTPPDFAAFERNVIAHPDMIPEGYFVACHQGQYVGVSSIWQRAGNDYLETDLTGVLPDHRRRGLARALKLAALAFAARRGQIVKTWNDADNQPILELNSQLGFARQPAWIDFVKTTS